MLLNEYKKRCHDLDQPAKREDESESAGLLTEPIAPRDLVSIHDLSPSEILSAFQPHLHLKQRPADFRGVLAGKQMVMFFEKPSLRTRLTFEAGMDSLGGSTFFVDQTASRLNARESLYDIAHNLERWIDLIVLRTFSHAECRRDGHLCQRSGHQRA